MARRSIWASLPTEAVLPASHDLDRMSARAVLELMGREDAKVASAVRSQARSVERAARMMANVLASGGRVFFAGAGTSGRLGVLEAAECPPTFGTDPDRIVAVIAGGKGAVFESIEGAEDRAQDGERQLRSRRLTGNDLVVGISASSVTPFVRGSLAFARAKGAPTVLITCGPRARGIADVVVAPRVGAEVLAGSTRMKAGTATKLVLNQITLVAMLRLKKVCGPFMVDSRPRSAKLRDRARRIVASLGSVDGKTAARLLDRSRKEVKTAIVMARLGVTADEARTRLRSEQGDLRAVIESGDARGRARRRPAQARRKARARRPRARPSG
jgi:N-acetylmuramic acid 6-phosphate etherase